jgi:DNA-binding NarL/FixJ family response regulator
MDYADALNQFNDAVSACAARAESNGLSNKEIAEELRRMAAEIEAEG